MSLYIDFTADPLHMPQGLAPPGWGHVFQLGQAVSMSCWTQSEPAEVLTSIAPVCGRVSTMWSQPRSQATPTSSLWLLALCRYREGRPGRSGHVWGHQIERRHTGVVPYERSQSIFL